MAACNLLFCQFLNLRSFTLLLLHATTLQEPQVNASGAAAAAAATATALDQSPNVDMPEDFRVNMSVSPAVLEYTGPYSPAGKPKPKSKRRKRSSNAGFNLNIQKKNGEVTLWKTRWPNARLRWCICLCVPACRLMSPCVASCRRVLPCVAVYACVAVCHLV